MCLANILPEHTNIFSAHNIKISALQPDQYISHENHIDAIVCVGKQQRFENQTKVWLGAAAARRSVAAFELCNQKELISFYKLQADFSLAFWCHNF